MPGSEAATTDGAAAVIDSLVVDDLPTIDDSELHNEWRRLVLDIRSTTLETDIAKRHSRSNFERALKLALTHPDSMSISTMPNERRYEMTDHVHEHFENLFNDDDWGSEFKRPRPNVTYLLKASELAYLYDSVYRFNRETIISSDYGGLEDLSFVELPDGLNEWMGEVNLLWLTLAGKLAAEKPLREWINRLYSAREDFVAEAKSREIFLPIRGEYLEDPHETKTKIKKRLSRHAHISPRLVHNYCFTRAVDLS